jgi:hypothetical protein
MEMKFETSQEMLSMMAGPTSVAVVVYWHCSNAGERLEGQMVTRLLSSSNKEKRYKEGNSK